MQLKREDGISSKRNVSIILGRNQNRLIAITIIISLPTSYDHIQAYLTANSDTMTLKEVTCRVLAEECRKQGNDTALKAALAAPKTVIVKDIKKCSNPKCGKSGHTIDKCWAKGGGKEGQGPKQREKGSKHKGKEKAKTADSMTNQNITMFMAHVANVAEEGNATTSWVVDSGVSSHMSAHRSLFQSYEILHTPHDISIANCLKIKAIRIGTVPINIKVDNQMRPTILKNVLHVPDLSANLLSIPTMAKHGIKAQSNKTGGAFVEDRTGAICARVKVENGLYILHGTAKKAEKAYFSIVQESHDGENGAKDVYAFKASKLRKSAATEEVWHKCLCHIMLAQVQAMAKQNIVRGMKITGNSSAFEMHQCEACMKGKQTRKPIPKATETRVTEVLECMYSDVCEVGVRSREGHHYYVTFMDDKSHYTKVVCIAHKSNVPNVLKIIVAEMETETGKSIKKLRTDGRGEYISAEVSEWLKSKGIVHKRMNPHHKKMVYPSTRIEPLTIRLDC